MHHSKTREAWATRGTPPASYVMNSKIKRAGFEERRFDTGEVELNYAAGPDKGTPLVLIPAQALCWESYLRVLPELSNHFQVFAVDPRGHGKSGRTPGRYSLMSMSRDVAVFLEGVVKRPAIVSGNSSGGVASVWLAANVPDLVLGAVPEDPPLFSAEWPRLKDDCWAFQLFERITETLGRPDGPDFGAFFDGLEVPDQVQKRIKPLPAVAGMIMSALIGIYRFFIPAGPLDIPVLPFELRVLIKSLSLYDPGFTRAFVDGSGCDIDHEQMLARVKPPMLLLQANWFRHPESGLVGAFDQADLERIRSLAPHCRYRHIDSGHVIHQEKPQAFIREIKTFAESIS